MHRAYRTLNDPPKLLGFTGWQWVALVLTGALAVGSTQLVGLPIKPAISFCALVLTTVAAIAYATEPGGMQPLGLLADALRMLARACAYESGMPVADPKSAIGVLVVGADERERDRPRVDRAAEVFVS